MGVYKQAKSKYYYCEFWVNGARYRKSTGKTDRREAEVVERRLRSEIESAPPVPITTHILGECFELDLERAQAKGTKKVSQADLKFHWKALLRHLGLECALSDVTFQAMTDYVMFRRADGARGQTIKRELYALRRGLRLAYVKGWVREIPATLPEVRRDPKDKRRAGKLHPPEVLTAFLNQLTPDARDEYTFILYTGLRWRELKRARFSWVIPAPQGSPVPAFLEIPDTGTKTGLARTVALPQAAYDIVQRRKKATDLEAGDLPIFSQQEHWVGVRAATKRIGYDKNITMRDMRKMWATMASRLGKDRDAVKSTLGHTSMNTTDIYVAEADRGSLAAAANAVADWAGGVVPIPQSPYPAANDSANGVSAENGGGKVVSAVGIEPTTYGLRVQPDSLAASLDASISEHLAALGDALRQLETGQVSHTSPHTIPWVSSEDVELLD